MTDEPALDAADFEADDDLDDDNLASPGPAPGDPAERRSAIIISVLVTTLSGGALAFGFAPSQAGNNMLLTAMGVCYGALLPLTLWWMAKSNALKQLLPRQGDIAFGALLAVGFYLVAVAVRLTITPRQSTLEPWLIRIYLQLGDPRVMTTFGVGVSVLLIAAAEEIVWRGGVMGALSKAYGARRGWLMTTAFYTLAHLSTVYYLRDPMIGPNPLVLVAALGGGLLWGFVTMRIGRLGLSVVAHALFVWAVVEYPILQM